MENRLTKYMKRMTTQPWAGIILSTVAAIARHADWAGRSEAQRKAVNDVGLRKLSPTCVLLITLILLPLWLSAAQAANVTYYWNTNTGTSVATGVTTGWSGCLVKPSTTTITLMTTTGYNCSDDEVNLAAPGIFWEAYNNTAYASSTTVTGVTFKVQVESSNYSSNTFRTTLFYVTAGGTKTSLGSVNFTTPAKAVQTINISTISGTVPAGAKLGVRAEGISNNTRVRSGGTGTTGAFFGELAVNEAPPTTTIGDGTTPASRNVGRSTTNRAVDAFTLSTSSGTDTVTGLTVTLSGTGAAADIAASGVKIWKDNGTVPNEWDTGDTQIGSGVSMSGTTATFSGLTEGITTTSVQYLITYDISSAATPGNTLLGRVSAVTVTNTLTNNDTTDNTLTVAAVSGTVYSDEGTTVLAGVSVKIV